jgi:aryl-alcohol dehydrogenase-like predicted oxidoreductase
MTNNQSRRSFLIQGAAAATAATLTRSAVGAPKRVRVSKPHSVAGAAGRMWIGGDLEVNRLGFGTTQVAGPRRSEPADPAAMHMVLRRAIELGVNFIDTADIYGPSERLIREALYPYPADLVISSKSGQIAGPGGRDGRPEHLRASCEASLKQLQLEQIALYYLHYPDPKVPYEDSVGELVRLQKEGKIRHIGVSNVNAAQLATARSVAKVVSVQNQYSILVRESDDIIAICEREHMAFVPWYALGGRDSGAMTKPDPRLAALESVAKARGIDMPRASIAWLLARSPAMLAIFGTSQVSHLEDDLAATQVHFTKQEMRRIG